MPSRVSRRSFVGRLAVGAGVSALGLKGPGLGADTTGVVLPFTRDKLTHDPAVLDEFSQDNGRIVRKRPWSVLRPRGIDDVATMVRFAHDHRRGPVAMRGQGHSSYGQAQVETGTVIDARPLRRILAVTDAYVDVEAGATWDEVLAATLPRRRTPPVLPDTQVLTVGGTVSVGGTGNASHRYGAIVDHVLELEAVTGRGDRVVCSPSRDRELFEMLLGGLGQCALIVRVRLALVPAPDEVVLRDYDYGDLDAFLADQRRLASDPAVDHLGGRVLLKGDRRFRLTVGTYAGPARKATAPTVRGTAAGNERRVPYLDYLHRTLPLIERGKQSGSWWWPSPSVMFFVPDSDAKAFVTDVLADPIHLEGTELFDGFAFLACPTRHFKRPLLPFPKEPLAFQAWIIRRTPPERVPAVLEANLALWERVKSRGGERYAGYGAVPFTPMHWSRHYGPRTWARLSAAKRAHDPNLVLTPGPWIF